jgi:hypothetical protein
VVLSRGVPDEALASADGSATLELPKDAVAVVRRAS